MLKMASKRKKAGPKKGAKKGLPGTRTTPIRITFDHPKQKAVEKYTAEYKQRFEMLEEQLRKSKTNTEHITCNIQRRQTVKFGRSRDDCDVVLDDENISRVYCELKVEDESNNDLKVFMYSLARQNASKWMVKMSGGMRETGAPDVLF